MVRNDDGFIGLPFQTIRPLIKEKKMSTKERDESGRWGVMRMEVPGHNVGHHFRKSMSLCRKRGRD